MGIEFVSKLCFGNYCLHFNLTMERSSGHMVEWPDSYTQLLCEVFVCYLGYVGLGLQPQGSATPLVLWHHMHYPGSQKEAHCCLHAIIQCKVHSRGCDFLGPVKSRMVSIGSMTKWLFQVYIHTRASQTWAFLRCRSIFQQHRPSDDHLSPLYTLFPLINDSLEYSSMTLPLAGPCAPRTTEPTDVSAPW